MNYLVHNFDSVCLKLCKQHYEIYKLMRTSNLDFAKKIDEEVFVIGGGNIYEQTMEVVDKLEVTLVKADLEADTFFPKIDPKIWKKTNEICHEKDEKNGYDFCFQTFEKIKNEA